MFAAKAVIAAVAGYLSEGVTIWEPVIAGIVLYALCYVADATLSIRLALLQDLAPPAVIFMSLYGADWGDPRTGTLEAKTFKMNPGYDCLHISKNF